LGIIWIFMFQYSTPGESQVGTLERDHHLFHHDPVVGSGSVSERQVQRAQTTWRWIGAATWGITGFAMVILSARWKGIPGALLERPGSTAPGRSPIFQAGDLPAHDAHHRRVRTTLVNLRP